MCSAVHTVFALMFLLFSLAHGLPKEDLMVDLPGLNFVPNFTQYSGYLKASENHFLHYWFTLSQHDPKNDPVVLWLNGGPGCSSLLGLLTELGSFRAMDWGKSLGENVFAWNKIANVLFVESPAGVGYSYSVNGDVATDDDKVAQENYHALIDFFHKFTEFYKKNSFYIAGESYAGVYLPTLAQHLINDRENFPTFKGMAIGNGYIHTKLMRNSVIPFLYYHALIPEHLWLDLADNCCDGKPGECDYYDLALNGSVYCRNLTNRAAATALRSGNPYDLYDSCYLPSSTLLTPGDTLISTYARSIWKALGLQLEDEELLNEDGPIPVCAQENATRVYLNRMDVRAAMHIPDHVTNWTMCR